MDKKIDTTCEHTKIRLIAAALGHQQCTKTEGTAIPLPGTPRYIMIGEPGWIARQVADIEGEGAADTAGIDLDKLTRYDYVPGECGRMAIGVEEGGAFLSYHEVQNALARRAAPVAPTDDQIDSLARKHNLDGSMLNGHRHDYWRAFGRDLLAQYAAQAAPVAPAGDERAQAVEQWRLKGTNAWYDVSAEDKDATLGTHQGYEKRTLYRAAIAHQSAAPVAQPQAATTASASEPFTFGPQRWSKEAEMMESWCAPSRDAAVGVVDLQSAPPALFADAIARLVAHDAEAARALADKYCAALAKQAAAHPAPDARQSANPAEQPVDARRDEMGEVMLAMQIAAEKLEWIAAGEAPDKNYDLDGGKVTATIRHAKQMAAHALTRLQPARSTMARLFRSERASPAAAPEAAHADDYGNTDFGYTFAGAHMEEGDKRLAALIVKALGTDHPAMDDFVSLLFRARPLAAPAPAADHEAGRDLYTCIGKGGQYEVLGYSNGAGTKRGETIVVYQQAGDDGTLYHRTCGDFDSRMERIDQSTASAVTDKEAGHDPRA